MQKYKIEHHQSNDCTCSCEEVIKSDEGTHYLVTEVDAEIDRLRAENGELLEVCKLIKEWVTDDKTWSRLNHHRQQIVTLLEAVILKAGEK